MNRHPFYFQSLCSVQMQRSLFYASLLSLQLLKISRCFLKLIHIDKEVLQVAYTQLAQTGAIKWHNLQSRPEDVVLGEALDACAVQPTTLMRAEYQGLRHYVERGDVLIAEEPLAREAIEDEAAEEMKLLSAAAKGMNFR